jgi:hypothetical protein
MVMYMREMIEKEEGVRLDATPDVAPWAGGKQRKETAWHSKGDSIEDLNKLRGTRRTRRLQLDIRRASEVGWKIV